MQLVARYRVLSLCFLLFIYLFFCLFCYCSLPSASVPPSFVVSHFVDEAVTSSIVLSFRSFPRTRLPSRRPAYLAGHLFLLRLYPSLSLLIFLPPPLHFFPFTSFLLPNSLSPTSLLLLSLSRSPRISTLFSFSSIFLYFVLSLTPASPQHTEI